MRLLLFTLLILSSCQQIPKDTKRIKADVQILSVELKSAELNRIQKITTVKGFNSILILTDSLRNKSNLIRLAENMEKFNVFSVVNQDTILILSLGAQDEVVGATGGYVFLTKVNDQYKIDEYRGGK